MTMTTFTRNRLGKILTTPDSTLLKVLGVREGKNFTLKVMQPFGGPVIVEIDNRKIAISRAIADDIAVVEC
jgi:ferrous iron transport protein A